MVSENVTQPLNGPNDADAAPGAPGGEPQPEPTEVQDQLGAETQASPDRSEDAFRNLQSSMDKQLDAKGKELEDANRQNSELRQSLTETVRKGAVEKAQMEEQQATERDRLAMDDGNIDSKEFVQRQTQRQTERNKAEETERGQVGAEISKVIEEYGAKAKRALDLSVQYEVDLGALLTDESLVSPALMELQAKNLQNEKLIADKPGQESFDSGRGNSAGASIDNMTGEQKIAYGLAHPPKKQPAGR